jgi:phosphoglycerate dehydrogenase-like enzyme
LSEYFASKRDTVKAIKSSKRLLLARSTSVPRDVLVALKQLSIIKRHFITRYSISMKTAKGRSVVWEKNSVEYETDAIKRSKFYFRTQNRNLVYASVF